MIILPAQLQLLIKLNDLMKSCLNDSETLNEIINAAVNQLKEFQIINNYLSQVKKLNKDINRNKLKTYLNDFLINISNQNKIIYVNAAKSLIGKNSILTLSNSKTVFEVLKRYSQENKKLKIFICESRPKNEGRVLTKLFLNENINCELILDAMLPHFIQKADAVIIGADKILKNGNAINKTGSLNAAILCKHYKKPFYVIASKEKISNVLFSNLFRKVPQKFGNITIKI